MYRMRKTYVQSSYVPLFTDANLGVKRHHHVRLQAGLGNEYVEISGQFFLQYYLQQLFRF